MVIGEDGPAIVAVASHFGWLNFLADPNWDDFFNGVTGTTIGHWVESPSAHWTAPAGQYKLKTQSEYLYIGYSPATSTYLRGELGASGSTQDVRIRRHNAHQRYTMHWQGKFQLERACVEPMLLGWLQ